MGALTGVTGHILRCRLFSAGTTCYGYVCKLSILVPAYCNRVMGSSTYMIFALPNIVNIAGVIWKDVQMASHLIVGGNAYLVHYGSKTLDALLVWCCRTVATILMLACYDM